MLVDCQWSPWESRSCTKVCGGGYISEHRGIMSPALNGGSECSGISQRDTSTTCNTDECQGNIYQKVMPNI